MRIAILGGGISGLTAAYYLKEKNHQITLFEKEKDLGGMSSGFKNKGWSWPLERTYHHIFSNDYDIMDFGKDIGFKDFLFFSPITASLYNSGLFALDTPIDLLRLPLLSFTEKIRAGLIILFLKFSPFFSFYEKMTAEHFLKKTMGQKTWEVLWQNLFRKKYGKYAGNILASFIWARIKKRTKNLGYPKGGFQTFINYVVKKLKDSKVKILTNYEIKEIKKRGKKYILDGKSFDKVISTLPTPVLIRIGKNIFPEDYLKRLSKIKYLHAVTLILETREPLLKEAYWLNISTSETPIMAIVQHTNFIDKKYYANRHLTYFGWYVDDKNQKLKMNPKQLLTYIKPYIKKLTNRELLITDYFVFKTGFAQPIFNKEFIKNKPDFKTPLKNFYIANLDMTYPYDRGTNYAVKIGKQTIKIV